jgi:hypothetical protein
MALSKILVLQPCQGCQLAPAAADLPSIQLQAAQLRQLAVAEGTAVSWCVALKPPQSTRVLAVDCNDSSASWQEADTDHWLQSRLLNQVGGCPSGQDPQLFCHNVGAASLVPASEIPE